MGADAVNLRPDPVPRWQRPDVIGLVAICLVLSLGFLGLRGIWDPDEGRYTNVALTMLDTGNWLDPMRNEDTGHWTKPPVTYWLVAGSVSLFGHSPWAARLPIALSYLACMLFAGLCARRLVPGAVPLAVIVYATMIIPSVAGQLVTTDFPLAASLAFAMYAFVEYRFGPEFQSRRWWILMWVAFGIAFMTKGPPALVPLLAVLAMSLLAPGPKISAWWRSFGVVTFLVIALPWYIAVTLKHDGLLQYFLGAELVDRVATARFGRHSEWYGWLQVYLPTLALGTLPWSLDLWRWARSLPTRARAWRDKQVRVQDARRLLIALWIVIPVVVFCVAQSRLPLYLLPTFVPLALAISAQRNEAGRGMPRWPWLVLWVALLLGARAGAAYMPTHKDASKWAEAIKERVAGGPIHEVVFVEDMARYGLHMHLDTEIEKLSRLPMKESRFNPEYDEALMREVDEVGEEPGLIFVTKAKTWPEIAQSIAARGYTAQPLGTPYQGRVIFIVHPPQETTPR